MKNNKINIDLAKTFLPKVFGAVQTFSKHLTAQLLFEIGITRLSDCKVVLLGMCVVTSAIVDATLNFLIDDVLLSEDDEVVIALSVKLSKSVVSDKSAIVCGMLCVVNSTSVIRIIN